MSAARIAGAASGCSYSTRQCRSHARPGAKALYVSAAPTENTDFYLNRGCVLAPGPDRALLASEPDDILLV